MPIRITHLHAIEILDCRARPTLSVAVGLPEGIRATAAVPSGASNGFGEAVELRDVDPDSYGGDGVLTAVTHVNNEIAHALRGQDFVDQAGLDQALVALDGTRDKSRLGANAIIGVSIAAARAEAAHSGVPLWRHLAPEDTIPRLPVPHFNVLGGGSQARNPLDFQEFMIAPLGAPSVAEAVRAGVEVYTALRHLLADAGYATDVGDEGGFAPDLIEPEHVLRLLVWAISEAGYIPSRKGVAIALYPAASDFRQPDGTYRVAGQSLSSTDMITRYEQIAAEFPVWSIEDGLGHDDPEGWVRLTAALGERVQLVGGDNLLTSPARIAKAIGDGVANAALIKPNQVGTVTETLEAMAVCRGAGYAAMVSHCAGETDDSFIADLAVGSGCGQLKSGAPARGEHIAKYNRLLDIAATHRDMPYGLPD